MKNPTDDDAYDALFRSYKDSNKRIKELEAQLVDVCAENERMKESVVWDVINALAEKDDYKRELAAANAENAKLNAASLQLATLRPKLTDCEAQLAAAQAEIERLKKQNEQLKMFRAARRRDAMASKDRQIGELQAEITRLREGGCAREH